MCWAWMMILCSDGSHVNFTIDNWFQWWSINHIIGFQWMFIIFRLFNKTMRMTLEPHIIIEPEDHGTENRFACVTISWSHQAGGRNPHTGIHMSLPVLELTATRHYGIANLTYQIKSTVTLASLIQLSQWHHLSTITMTSLIQLSP